MSGHQRTEWGVLWDETGEVEPCDSRHAAEQLRALHAVWDSRIVNRTITYTQWKEATQ